jgi:hypothetical protein
MLTPLLWERIQVGEMGPAAAISVISLAIMLVAGVIMRRVVASYMKGE